MFIRRITASLLTIGVAAGMVAVSAPPVHAAPVTVQVLGINDFHGRIVNGGPGGPEAGAAVLTGAVKQLELAQPNTVFAAAGDLIGASTFESFIAEDKPTIDALNAAGLDVSAAGNHEFDQGYSDLLNRVMQPASASNPRGGAAWQYLAANVRTAGGSPALATGANNGETWMTTIGGIDVGFIGAVTDELPSLVSPDGIAGLTIEAPVVAANRSADALKAAGADIIILLVHEGAVDTTFASATNPATAFGKIVTGVNDNVDAIVSGHTHLAYNHAVPVPGWAGRPVTTRPVVSAGQYGTNLNRLLFTIDDTSKQITGITQDVLALTTNTTVPPAAPNWVTNYPADAPTAAIVAAARANADVLGAVPLGNIGGPFNRAIRTTATTPAENRGGESTIGNLVAEVQRWATEAPESGAAEIAFMNPGGLRQDMRGVGPTYPTTLTYQQAAVVQPFANTLVNMTLTGAQIRTVLEQQWQPAGASRPYLRLGVSDGFTYTYDPDASAGSRVLEMWLNDTPIADTDTFSVTVNSFLAAGGDNFGGFAAGTNKRDTGKADLQAMVDYMAQYATTPLAVDYAQHAVGVNFPAGAPSVYRTGDHVRFDISSLAMSTADDLKDANVTVSLGDTVLGTFPVNNTIGTDAFDENGKAAIDVVVPPGVGTSEALMIIEGATTGTTSAVAIPVEPADALPLTPARLLDTRTGESTVDGQFAGIGRAAARSVTTLKVAGRGGVPADASAAMLNLTIANPAGNGYATIYPCSAAVPHASNINFLAGQFVANGVAAKLDANGEVCVYTLADADIVVDVNGFLPVGSDLTTVVPARLLDTRPGEPTIDGLFAAPGRAAARSVTRLKVAGRGGVAADASAALLNLTIANPAEQGFATIYPCTATPPRASNINYRAGQFVANGVAAKLDANGEVCIYTLAAAEIVVDALGSIAPGASVHTLAEPARLLDTRPGEPTVDGQFAGVGRAAARSVTKFKVAGRAGIPAEATTAWLNLTIADAGGNGFATIYPCTATPPNASNINYFTGTFVANGVLAKLNDAGEVCVYTLAPADIVVDISAYDNG